MAILACVAQLNDNSINVYSDTAIDSFEGMPVMALPSMMGLFCYSVTMDSIESIVKQKEIDKALDEALKQAI